MPPRPFHRVRLLPAIAALLAVAACASGGASRQGPKRTVLLDTQYADARAGEESSKQVAAEIGLIDDPALQGYVSEIGRRLLRGVPRRGFDFQFSIVDQVEPNAFALPGGYIFISRGLLLLANDEDELACVMGHEIVHAVKRHAAAAQAYASTVNPLAMPWNRAAVQAAYGRDMERDADEGGQQLCAAAGYDPMALSTFLRSLEQLELLRQGYSRPPSFFDSHPGSRERAAANAVRANEMRWHRDPALGDTRARLLQHIDGLAVGGRPAAGMFVGDVFVHPVLGFRIHFPAGWRQMNTNQAVGAIQPEGDAVVYLTADLPEGDPKDLAQIWVERMRTSGEALQVADSRPVKVGAIDCWRLRIEQRAGPVRVASSITFVPYHESTWRIAGTTRDATWSRYQGPIQNTARSFRPLQEGDLADLRVMRLALVEARPGETLPALHARTGDSWDLARAAIYNGVFVSHRFEGGETVKIAKSEPYVPPVR